MKKLILLMPLLLLTACAKETRVIRDNSASTTFARMFGGEASAGGETSGSFQMTRGGVTTNPNGGPVGDATPQAQRIAQILRAGGAGVAQPIRENPNNIKVITSFQTDEPKPKPNAAPSNAPPPTVAPQSFDNPQPLPAQ